MKAINLARLSSAEVDKLARAAGNDAANRAMRKRGDTEWSEADYGLACRTYHRVMALGECRSRTTHCYEGKLVTV